MRQLSSPVLTFARHGAEAWAALQDEYRAAQHDLKAAAQSGDPDRIRQAAHDLKEAEHELTQHLARPV